MSFDVGQQVICVNAGLGFGSGRPVDLKLYAAYTVGGFDEAGHMHVGGIEHYCPSRFRPIQERKTDISVFTKMLDSVPA